MAIDQLISTPLFAGNNSTGSVFNSIHDKMGLVGVEDLVAVLVQCFVVINAGYISGRFGLISETESKGLASFVSYFSLPALIFTSLATLNLSNISWAFVASIFISKAFVFFAVVLTTMFLTRPSNMAKAGLYGIFCTQSNDFALGYPVLNSLYGPGNVFSNYLYVLAPIQLLILNPVAIFLMEIQRQWERQCVSNTTQRNTSRLGSAASASQTSSLMWPVFKGIFTNPVIIMTILGLIWNATLTHTIPTILASSLTVLSNAFSASALFLLGLNMVGKFSSMKGSGTLMTPMLLIIVKVMVLPLIMRVVVERAVTDPAVYADMSQFSFLYGTFPAAPTVFIFALQYDLPTQVVASGMVICTILSAPLMFVSANMIRLAEDTHIDNFFQDLGSTMSFVSLLSIPCLVWVLLLLLLGRKWTSLTHRCTIALASCQLMHAVGGYLWQFVNVDHPDATLSDSVTYHSYYILSVAGCFAARVWTAILAVTLALLHWKSLCYAIHVHRKLMLLAGTLTLAIFLLIVFAFKADETQIRDPNFKFGAQQAMLAVMLLMFCLLTSMISLLVQHHFAAKLAASAHAVEEDEDGNNEEEQLLGNSTAGRTPLLRARSRSGRIGRLRRRSNSRTYSTNSTNIDPVLNGSNSHDVEDLGEITEFSEFCRTSAGCCKDSELRKACHGDVRKYRDSIVTSGTEVTPLIINELLNSSSMGGSAVHQVLSHVVLVLVMCLSMLVGLVVSTGKMISEQPTGIFLELEFLDIVLNYGQGIVTFIMFGLDATVVFDLFNKLWYRRRQSSGLRLPDVEDLTPATKKICEQFRTYHQDKCREEITFELCVNTNCQAVFKASDLVDWLVAAGLAPDRRLAENYGGHLLIGRLIEHVTREQHFQDGSYFYKFLEVSCARGVNGGSCSLIGGSDYPVAGPSTSSGSSPIESRTTSLID